MTLPLIAAFRAISWKPPPLRGARGGLFVFWSPSLCPICRLSVEHVKIQGRAETDLLCICNIKSSSWPGQRTCLFCLCTARLFYYKCVKSAQNSDSLNPFFSCLNYSDHTNTFTNNMALPLYPHPLLISLPYFLKGWNNVYFQTFPMQL